MKNKLILGMIIICTILGIENVHAENKILKTVRTIQNSAYGDIDSEDIFNNDLLNIERYLFGKTYYRDTLNSRISRIEKHLFNRTYDSMHITRRMNHIISNYRNDYYNNHNYLADYYSNKTPIQRVYNRFMGQPTGFTPSIIDSPFRSINPGYSQNYSGTRGYGYRNSIPAMSGASVRILD